MEQMKNKIAVWIHNLRKQKNLTQEQMAEKLSVSVRCIQKWESGKTLPDCLHMLILLLPQLNIAEKTQAEIENIKAQKRRRADAHGAFVMQKFFIYVKYFWQGLVGGAIILWSGFGIYYLWEDIASNELLPTS